MLEPFSESIRFQEYLAARSQQMATLVDIAFWEPVRAMLRELSSLPPGAIDPAATVSIGRAGEIGQRESEQLGRLIETLLPWRKGPLNLFGHHIDAEWRSDLKWDRIRPFLDPLRDRIVGDVGCNNGYYLFRMLAENPALGLGLDPNGRYFYQFELLRTLSAVRNLVFEPLGIEHLSIFPAFFDVLLCMGVIYHRKDPLGSLQLLREALKPGGQLIFESMAIPGDAPHCLFPADRYGKMKNVWFIPTEGCMEHWLRRSAFEDVQKISAAQLSPAEQRKTRLAPYESLADFLDPADPGKTVEGYPAPLRVAYSARRPLSG